MLKTFVLLATMWTPGADVPTVYILDSGISGADCIESMMIGAIGVDFGDGEIIDLTGAILSCEFDRYDPFNHF